MRNCLYSLADHVIEFSWRCAWCASLTGHLAIALVTEPYSFYHSPSSTKRKIKVIANSAERANDVCLASAKEAECTEVTDSAARAIPRSPEGKVNARANAIIPENVTANISSSSDSTAAPAAAAATATNSTAVDNTVEKEKNTLADTKAAFTLHKCKKGKKRGRKKGHRRKAASS